MPAININLCSTQKSGFCIKFTTLLLVTKWPYHFSFSFNVGGIKLFLPIMYKALLEAKYKRKKIVGKQLRKQFNFNSFAHDGSPTDE